MIVIRTLLLAMFLSAPLVAQSRAEAEAIADSLSISRLAMLHVAALKSPVKNAAPRAICLSMGTPRPNIQGQVVAMKNYQDPSRELVKALVKPPYPIVVGSHCYADLKQNGTITDSSSRPHRQAMAIVLSPPRIATNGMASILVERAYGLQNAYGYICLLNKKKSDWTIESCTLTWNT